MSDYIGTHIVKGKYAFSTQYPYSLAPIKYKTTEEDYPTIGGIGLHREYTAKFLLNTDKAGYLYYNPCPDVSISYEDGFTSTDRLYGYLNLDNGYFHLKVNDYGLPMQAASLAMGKFWDGQLYGVQFRKYNTLDTTGLIMPGRGIFFLTEWGTLIYAAFTESGFVDCGQFPILDQQIVGESGWWFSEFKQNFGSCIQDVWRRKIYFKQFLQDKSKVQEFNCSTQGSISTSITTYDKVQYITGWINNQPKPNNSTYAYVATNAIQFNDKQCYVCRKSDENVYMLRFANGRWGELYHGINPVYHNYQEITKINYVEEPDNPSNNYVSNSMVMQPVWKLIPSDLISGGGFFNYEAFTEKKIIVNVLDGMERYLRTFVIDITGQTPSVDLSFRFDQTPYYGLGCYSVLDDKVVAFSLTDRRMLYDLLQNTWHNWRDVFLIEKTGTNYPDTKYVHNKAYYGGQGIVPAYVFYNNCLELTPSLMDTMMIIKESEFIDLSGGCSTGSYRGKARYKIVLAFSQTPVENASVSIKCRMYEKNTNTTKYENTFTETTDANGEVYVSMPSCVAGQAPVVIEFEVLNAEKTGLNYSPGANLSNAKVSKEYITLFSPDPAEFEFSSPFQLVMSGTYYHVMIAVVPTIGWTPDYPYRLQYRFECIDNPNFSSDWRDVDTVAGLFFPNGTPQVPEQYWRNVGAKNLMYKWTVQYRKAVTLETSQKSAQKQITNTLP